MATYQSLYRRYRPQRFDEVLGQDHVTRALRNAVRDDRVGHAYLFSGPRGTGKTSTARILAKVLNCAAPEDGEPCGACESCVAVAEGRVVDWLLEQDAASKSKVDDMRDLLERVPLGTSGNRKVIILDEVHMLSQGAENALLKTLEEPPAHVVFVLATTDPQKVRPTIRSRTQHFEFRLLPPEVMADHVRHVIADAGLALDAAAVDQAIDHVIRSGGGSARDTLSALDQVAALGEVVDESQPVDAILEALCDHDPGKALVAVADALASGRDPRTLGEQVIAGLRDAFLSVMGVADTHLPPAERERAANVGRRLGAAGLTRALDVLGEALVELSRKPDPRVVVEVALVKLTQPATDRTLDAILERLDRVERAIASGAAPAGPDAGGPPSGGAAPAGAGQTTAAERPPGASASDKASMPPSTGAGVGPAGGAAAARDALTSARAPRPSDAGGAQAPPTGPGSGQPTLGAVTRGRRGKASRGQGRAGESSGTPEVTGTSPPATASTRDSRAQGTPTAGTTTSSGTSGAAGGSGPGPAAPGPSTSPVTPEANGAPAFPSSGPSSAVDADPAGSAAGASAGSGVGLPTVGELQAAWNGGVLAGLPVKIRSKWRGGRWIEPGDGSLRFAVPNTWHQNACDQFRRDVEQALAERFGRPLAVSFVIEGGGGDAVPLPGDVPAGPLGGGRSTPMADDTDEHIDPSELRDADDVAATGVDLLLREFGGGEVVEEEP